MEQARIQARVDLAGDHLVQRKGLGLRRIDEAEHVVTGGRTVAVDRDVVGAGGQRQQVAPVVGVTVVEGVALRHRRAIQRPAQVVAVGEAVEVQRAGLRQREAVVLGLPQLGDAAGDQAMGQRCLAHNAAGGATQRVGQRGAGGFVHPVQRHQIGLVAGQGAGIQHGQLGRGQRTVPDGQLVHRHLAAAVVVAIVVVADAQGIGQIHPGHRRQVAAGHLHTVQHHADLRVGAVVHGSQLVPDIGRDSAAGRLHIAVAIAGRARLGADLNAAVVVEVDADLGSGVGVGLENQRNPAVGRRPVNPKAGLQRVRAGLAGGGGVGKLQKLRVADLHRAARARARSALHAGIEPAGRIEGLHRCGRDVDQPETEVGELVVVAVVAIDDDGVGAAVGQRGDIAVGQARAAEDLAPERVYQAPGRVELARRAQASKVHRVAGRGCELEQLGRVARVQVAADGVAVLHGLGGVQPDHAERKAAGVAAAAIDGKGVVAGRQVDDAVVEVGEVFVECDARAVDAQVQRVAALVAQDLRQRIEVEIAALRQVQVNYRLLAGLVDAAGQHARQALEAAVDGGAQVAG